MSIPNISHTKVRTQASSIQFWVYEGEFVASDKLSPQNDIY